MYSYSIAIIIISQSNKFSMILFALSLWCMFFFLCVYVSEPIYAIKISDDTIFNVALFIYYYYYYYYVHVKYKKVEKYLQRYRIYIKKINTT